jgi:peptidoglycan/xylan/chitin deacetylase (PgdA/CDA1 family)
MRIRGRIPRSEQGAPEAARWARRADTALNNARQAILNAYPAICAIDGTQSADTIAEQLIVNARAVCTERAPFFKKVLLWISSIVAVAVPDQSPAVLMYHAVDYSGWKLSIKPSDFERQMRHLKTHRNVVPLEDVVAHVKGDTILPPRSVAITFDDGYHDLVEHVLPVIQKFHLPITVFLTTDLSAQVSPLQLPRITKEDIRVLKGSGLVAIESHGRAHAHLPRFSVDEIERELAAAQNDLKELDGSTRFFAYPYGDRSQQVERAVCDAGYEAAFSITEGLVHQGAEPMHIKRIQVDATASFWMFKKRLTSAVEINRKLVDSLRRLSV